MLSHQRRHNGEMAEINEAPTLQKHRFRNALSRANGIKVRQDIAIDGGRVCEFGKPSQPRFACLVHLYLSFVRFACQQNFALFKRLIGHDAAFFASEK